jgi:hypothetical protein
LDYELELNLRIKPKKRIVREKPETLTVPEAINETWSMDFMHDGLSDGRSFRLFNVIEILTGRGWGSRSIFLRLHNVSSAVWNVSSIGEVSRNRFVVTMGLNISARH